MGSHSKLSVSQIKALDSVRGIAILLVLWDHSLGISQLNDRILRFFLPGHFGVDIFFVLSGFLITRILLAGKANGDSISLFLARRFLRIFPIYYLLLALFVVLRPDRELIWCASYLSNFYFCFHDGNSPLRHTWSLCVEEHFYLIWPFIIFFLPRRSSFVVAGALIAASLLSAFVLVFAPTAELRSLISYGSMCRFSSLALGGLLAFVEQTLRSNPRKVVVFSVLGVLLTFGIGVASIHFRPRHFGEFLMLVGGIPASTSIVLLGIALDPSTSWLGWIVKGQLLRSIGRISYGLYLYHYPILHSLGLMDRETDPQPLKFLLGLFLSFACAILSFILLEQPILRLKDRCRPVARTA